jgi:hypothetical protein
LIRFSTARLAATLDVARSLLWTCAGLDVEAALLRGLAIDLPPWKTKKAPGASDA